jgi:(S)-ureidoglycine aminohydrolase
MIVSQNLQTRSRRCPDHFLQTPDSFLRTPLPCLRNAMAIIHVGPTAGTQFAEYAVEFQSGGLLELNDSRCFLYVLEGEVRVEGHSLQVDDFAYIPAGAGALVSATRTARAIIIEVPFRLDCLNANVLGFFVGREGSIEPSAFCGDVCVGVRALIPGPSNPDFTVSTLTYQPGASLPKVESHATHGSMLMLAGGGILRLGEAWYLVTAGDFIWIGPGCLQWFGALGKVPARYLMFRHHSER